MSVCLCVWPIAPLRQTLQDVITDAELVISLAAVDALQGNRHQLVWVPNNLLLALEKKREEVSKCVLVTNPVVLLYKHTNALYQIEYFLPFECLCVCSMFSNSQETCPWLCPNGVINITFTAQGYLSGHDIAQIQSVCVVSFCCPSIYGWPSVTPSYTVCVSGYLRLVWSAGR